MSIMLIDCNIIIVVVFKTILSSGSVLVSVFFSFRLFSFFLTIKKDEKLEK